MFAIWLVSTLFASFVSLSDLDLSAMTAGWGDPHKNRSVEDHPLTIAGVKYDRGVGSHARSKFRLDLHGGVTKFEASVGLDDETQGRGSVQFVVEVDGHEKARSQVMKPGMPAQKLSVDTAGAKSLTLLVTDAGDGIAYDHADWADAVFTLREGAKAPTPFRPDFGPTLPILMAPPAKPQIHGATVLGGSPGCEFVFRAPATGAAPLKYRFIGLPHGLKADGPIVRGVLPAEGTYSFTLKVGNKRGSDVRTYRLVVGKHKLSLTPPMGWNSWNAFGLDVTQQRIEVAADAFVKDGLAAYGYRYVNIDDGWEASARAADGAIVPNSKFPDIRALAHDLHAKGLKFGIYSSPGPMTCGGFLGSYKHEQQDAKTYASWGVDYLKYDWCSYGQIAKDDKLATLQLPYNVMREALDNCGRDIFFSLCQYGMGDVWKWGPQVGGDCWRTTGDITDRWESMIGIASDQERMTEYAHVGAWNDPDMLVVGRLGWSNSLHASHLAPNEQITHVSLWAMFAAPLLIGCDLGHIDAFTKAVLCNHDIVAIDQDSLGKAARFAIKRDGFWVLVRPLETHKTAVSVTNTNDEQASFSFRWQELGFNEKAPIRDAWRARSMGLTSGSMTLKLPTHATKVYIVG